MTLCTAFSSLALHQEALAGGGARHPLPGVWPGGWGLAQRAGPDERHWAPGRGFLCGA